MPYLLQGPAQDVWGQVRRVRPNLGHVDSLDAELVAIVVVQGAADVGLGVVSVLLGLEEVRLCAAEHGDQRAELELSFGNGALGCQAILPMWSAARSTRGHHHKR
eukprot:CAMPEP_0177399360 /NCGR_PEP_ID=MMETSP0368-20130122/58443_1 /TAXON_ID=447022 ORGANISM="Scrippsiella hangoei-like, Strain SHHI-4" /NCGR_SAMPLE_ID=MMETSP0368 /ASSEMBLY_ACC=CAM_ASM_000363 /LENGTH=104 /DNA_ID=CAMNT_0018866605 /DNA_START=1034 /DNA_END=1344 /DNA_ORIENTATION=+